MKKLFYPFILLLVIGLYTECDVTSQAPNNKQLSTQFIIFADSGATDVHIASLIRADLLQKSQINYRYKNKGISGFSAGLSKIQINRINNKKYVNTHAIQGKFLITFKSPFDSTISNRAKVKVWTTKTITEIQKKYSINNSQIYHKYWTVPGFASKLNDKQLYELDHEKLVKYIEADARFCIGWPGNKCRDKNSHK